MGWQEEQYGKVYKSQKTKNAAQKAKNTKEKRKEATYNAVFTQQAQNYAKNHGLQYNDRLKNALNVAMTNKKREQDYNTLNQKHQEEWKEKSSKTSQPNRYQYHQVDEYKKNDYNRMRKEMGFAKKSGPLSQATYNALSADYQARQKDGSLDFLKNIKDGFGVKERPNQFDKKVESGLEKIGKFIDKTRKFSAKTDDYIKSKLGKDTSKKLDTSLKAAYQLSGLRNKVEGAKVSLKAMDKVDQYGGASSTRNVLADMSDGKNQSLKEYGKAIKQGFTGERRASGEEVAKNLGVDSKYGAKLAGLGIDVIADPTNLVGVGAYKAGAKAFKGVTALGKAVEEVKAVEKVKPLLLDAPKPGAKFENVKVVEPNKSNTQISTSEALKIEPYLDPVKAPLEEKIIPINDHIPYKKGDTLPDTTGHIVTKTKLVPKSIKEVANQIYTKGVDNYHPIKQAIKNYEKEVGRKLNPDENAYILALNSRHSDMTVNQMLNEGMVNKNGDVVGESLESIHKPIKNDPVKQTEFSDYLINKHAITRMERGEKVFPDEMQMNADKSRAKVAEYEAKHPEFKEQSEKLYQFDKNVLDYGKEHGLLTEELIDTLRKENPFYSPNQRSFDNLEKVNVFSGGKKGFANQNNTLKKATGSERAIIDPVESRIENVDRMVKASKKNEVMTSLIKLANENPEAMKPFMEIVPTKEGSEALSFGEDGVEGFLDEFNKMYDQKPDLQHGNTVFGLIDGKKVHVKVNDLQFLEALTNLDPMSRDFVTRNVGEVTNMFKTVTTGVNPFFALRNAMRDSVQGYANSKTVNNPFKYARDLGSAIVNVIKNDVESQAFKNIGGGHSSAASADRDLLLQSKNDVLGNRSKIDKLKNIPRKIKFGLENFNNTLEMAPRLAEYKRVKKEYNKLQENPNYKSKVLQAGVSEHGANIQGLYEANDITLNFKKYGNHTKNVDAYVPYLNAAVQGLDKLARSFAENPIKYGSTMVAKSVASVSIPTMLLYAVNHDDPAYQELSDEVKDQNFCIPMGDGKFFKIPKPRELSTMFGAPIERTMRSMWENDPDAFKHFSDSLMYSFLPPTRTIFAPLNDIRANKDYNGAPIVPMDLMQGSPENQYDVRTSEVAKKLGKLTGTSPKNLDYLAKSYGGLFSQVGIPATSSGSSVFDVIKRQYVADPVFSNDTTRDFYDEKEKVDQAYYDSTHGHPEVKVDLALREDLNRRAKEMGDQRKEMKQLQNNKNIPNKKKQEDLRKMQELINQLANLKNR